MGRTFMETSGLGKDKIGPKFGVGAKILGFECLCTCRKSHFFNLTYLHKIDLLQIAITF
jgi:hypothetical protein